jgi:predicted TIM-barrel fold metal-dependent hydrolase
MFVDMHTHIFPPQIANRTLKGLRERFDITFCNKGTPAALLTSMEDAGIDVSVISRIAITLEQVDPVNEWLISFTNRKVEALAAIHPCMRDGPEKIKSLKENGFKGIKVHPDYQGFYADEKRMFPFYEAAQAEGMPILFHAGLDRSLSPPWHASPDRLRRVQKDFPHLNVIAAHMGGEGHYDEAERELLGSNVYLDTSFVLRIMPLSTLKRFVKKHPVERILFGSDNPWRDQHEELEYLLSLSFLSDDEKERITGLNAARLFGL